MVQLLSLDPELSTEQQMAIEGALLQEEVLADSDLAIAEELLRRWQQSLTSQMAASGRRRR